MLCYDVTHEVLSNYLKNTERLMNELLSKKFSGKAKISMVPDLGFPHDVIRIAGGFATGAHIEWDTDKPFIPVDTCVNVCSTSFFEIGEDISELLSEENLNSVKVNLANGIYLSNFHRGNHFVAYLKGIKSGKRYLLLHSSANEFKDNYNGLYPVKGNWYYDHIKTYTDGNTYIRYLDEKYAEMFYRIAQGLYEFNEIRHEFIANIILKGTKINGNPMHFHHYGMPTSESISMGCHVICEGKIVPVLSLPGENLYMIKFNSIKDETLRINKQEFITPHGWGKCHKGIPRIMLDLEKNMFFLDEEKYDIKYGTSLRAHPNLELRDFQKKGLSRRESFFSYLATLYDFEIIDELEQIVSWNKLGVKKWV